MPDLFLKDELQIARWTNIPHPLLKLAEQCERSFGNTCNIMREIIKQNKSKHELLSRKFMKDNSKNEGNNQRINRSIEICRTNLTDLIKE